jgi:hypothetical protein
MHLGEAERYWFRVAKGREWWRKLALRLDKEAAVTEMIEQGFWG